MAKAYGKWIVVAVVLFLAAVGGYIYWRNQQQAQAVAQSEQLSAAIDKLAGGNSKTAAAELTPLSESSNDVTRASALLARATIALKANDRKTAIALYKQVADDGAMPQPYRDLATVRLTMTEYDSLKPDEVIARLKELSEPGHPFFGSAGEMTGLALLAKGDRAGAGRLFAKIAADKQVPESIRARAVQIASSLGIDATASIPVDLTANPAQ